jgi:hypothetical protein
MLPTDADAGAGERDGWHVAAIKAVDYEVFYNDCSVFFEGGRDPVVDRLDMPDVLYRFFDLNGFLSLCFLFQSDVDGVIRIGISFADERQDPSTCA